MTIVVVMYGTTHLYLCTITRSGWPALVSFYILIVFILIYALYSLLLLLQSEPGAKPTRVMQAVNS